MSRQVKHDAERSGFPMGEREQHVEKDTISSKEIAAYENVLKNLEKGQLSLTKSEREEFINKAEAAFTYLSKVYKAKAPKLTKIGWREFANQEELISDPEGFAATLKAWDLLTKINGYQEKGVTNEKPAVEIPETTPEPTSEIIEDLEKIEPEVIPQTTENQKDLPPPIPLANERQQISDTLLRINQLDTNSGDAKAIKEQMNKETETTEKLNDLLKEIATHCAVMPKRGFIFQSKDYKAWDTEFNVQLSQLETLAKDADKLNKARWQTDNSTPGVTISNDTVATIQSLFDEMHDKKHAKRFEKLVAGIIIGAVTVGTAASLLEKSYAAMPEDQKISGGEVSGEIAPAPGAQQTYEPERPLAHKGGATKTGTGETAHKGKPHTHHPENRNPGQTENAGGLDKVIEGVKMTDMSGDTTVYELPKGKPAEVRVPFNPLSPKVGGKIVADKGQSDEVIYKTTE